MPKRFVGCEIEDNQRCMGRTADVRRLPFRQQSAIFVILSEKRYLCII